MKIARLMILVFMLMLAGCGGISIDYLIARAHNRLFPDADKRIEPIPTFTTAPTKIIQMVTPTLAPTATPAGASTPQSALPLASEKSQPTAPEGLGSSVDLPGKHLNFEPGQKSWAGS